MAFHVINLETGEPERFDGTVLVWETGAEAASAARNLTERHGKRFQPRPVLDTSWREREEQRLLDGTYQRVPWDLDSDADYRARRFELKWAWCHASRKPEAQHHYAHVSRKVPGNIAFTESDEKGARDIQTSMKIGRYLARFYDLSDNDVKLYANEFIAQFGAINLNFATTADEFERVYVNGPRSCMAHEADYFRSSCHPVRVYAAGDIQLAYLTASSEDETAISGRVLVWPERKIYSRIYGDEQKLAKLLEAQGYHRGDLSGARLRRIECRGAFVMPYVDGPQQARDEGDYLVLDEDGELNCDNTNGLSSENGEECYCCGGRFDRDDLYSVNGCDGLLCESCESENTYYCQYNEETYYGDDYVHMANGETWSQDAFDRHGFQCEGNHRNYPNDDCVTLADGTCWSRGYFEDNGFVCSGNGDCYDNDDAVTGTDGDTYSRDYIADHPELDPDKQDAPEDDAAPSHKPRQGRDEHVNQMELELA